MSLEWIIAISTSLATVTPVAGLLLTLHDRNTRARQREAEVHYKSFKRMFKRMDHLDKCIDDVRERVARIEGRQRGGGSVAGAETSA